MQLLDTRLHGRCVGQNRSRGRGLIFLSKKVLVLFWQNASVFRTLFPLGKVVLPGTPKQKKQVLLNLLFLVSVAGLEPARCHQRGILSPLRLPIPSHRHLMLLYNSTSLFQTQAKQMRFPQNIVENGKNA